jgi:hypothetical protein
MFLFSDDFILYLKYKRIQLRKKEIMLFLFSGDFILYLKYSKDPTERLLELTNLSKYQDRKSTYQSQ